MSKMKISKAVNLDLIPAWVLKESAEILCSPFSTFNFILDTGKIPQNWKKGEIIIYSPQKGVHPDERKLQASDNTSLAI